MPLRFGAPLRIVTLAPALTQMLVDLGHRDELVGKSEYDTAAPASVPVVGNYLEVQMERLLKLHPTHVLMMPGKEGPPARLLEAARRYRFGVVTYPYPNTIAEVLRILEGGVPELRVADLGGVLGDVESSHGLRRQIIGKLSRLKKVCDAGKSRPRVLMVIGTGPMMASGPGTVLDELLTGYCGAVNAAGGASVGAPTYNRESMLKLAPDAVLLLLPDAPPLQAIEQDSRLAELRGLPINAVKRNRVVLLAGSQLLLPSSNLPAVAATLAREVHPELSAEIDKAVADAPAATAASTQPAATSAPAPGAKDNDPAPAHDPAQPKS
ncbi:MAG: ABC transporter substrate-binding protein [Planctomycetota bacterium]|nr:ABC transporter substrate-binding protein [Planctomycetota bacterium]